MTLTHVLTEQLTVLCTEHNTTSVCTVVTLLVLLSRWQYLDLSDRVPTLLLTNNSRTFPELSRTPTTFFQDSFVAQQCLNIQTNSSYLLYIYSVTVTSSAKHSSKKLFD